MRKVTYNRKYIYYRIALICKKWHDYFTAKQYSSIGGDEDMLNGVKAKVVVDTFSGYIVEWNGEDVSKSGLKYDIFYEPTERRK